MKRPPLSQRVQVISGYALPVAVLAIIVISMLALTGLYVAHNNLTANTGLRRGSKALYAADAGSNYVLANWNSAAYGDLSPGDSVDTGWRALPDSSVYRTVVLRVDTGNEDSALYRLRTVGRPGRGVTAQRNLVRMVRVVRPVDFCCRGALEIQGELDIRGTGSQTKIDGRDVPPAAWGGACPDAAVDDLPGIRIQDEDDLSTRGHPQIIGEPPVLEDPTINDDRFTDFGGISYSDLADMADKEYPGGQNLNGLGPSTLGEECNTSDPYNWGDPLDSANPCFDYFPIVHVSGDLKLSGNSVGQGVLLVDGDLEISGNVEYDGVVLVQGQADIKGTADVTGGLMVRNDVNGLGDSYARGDMNLQFSSCVVDRVLDALAVASPLAGRHWFEAVQ